jgi:hypothetical protein
MLVCIFGLQQRPQRKRKKEEQQQQHFYQTIKQTILFSINHQPTDSQHQRFWCYLKNCWKKEGERG